MATTNVIRWNNISAPSFSGVQTGLAQGGQTLTNSLDKLAKLGQQYGEDQEDQFNALRTARTNEQLGQIASTQERDNLGTLRDQLLSKEYDDGVSADRLKVMNALNQRDQGIMAADESEIDLTNKLSTQKGKPFMVQGQTLLGTPEYDDWLKTNSTNMTPAQVKQLNQSHQNILNGQSTRATQAQTRNQQRTLFNQKQEEYLTGKTVKNIAAEAAFMGLDERRAYIEEQMGSKNLDPLQLSAIQKEIAGVQNSIFQNMSVEEKRQYQNTVNGLDNKYKPLINSLESSINKYTHELNNGLASTYRPLQDGESVGDFVASTMNDYRTDESSVIDEVLEEITGEVDRDEFAKSLRTLVESASRYVTNSNVSFDPIKLAREAVKRTGLTDVVDGKGKFPLDDAIRILDSVMKEAISKEGEIASNYTRLKASKDRLNLLQQGYANDTAANQVAYLRAYAGR